jgi:hypothetical protein
MKLFILTTAFVLAITTAQADDKTPYVGAKTSKEFKENTATKVFFYSKKDKSLLQAGACEGKDCAPTNNSVSTNQDAKDKPELVVATTLNAYTLKKDSLVTLTYTVTGDSTIYKRVFILSPKADEPSGFELALKEESVVLPGTSAETPAPATGTPATPGSTTITSYEQLVASLKASGPDYNGNGIADHLDAVYYGLVPPNATVGNGTCGHYASRAARLCQGWGIPVKIVHYNVSVLQKDAWGRLVWGTALHAIIKVHVAGQWHYIEPQLGGQLTWPTAETEYEPY